MCRWPGRKEVMAAMSYQHVTKGATIMSGYAFSWRLIAITSVLTVSLFGAAPTRAQEGSPVASEAGRTSYPLTVENCGFEYTYNEPPSRIVSIFSPATETLVALGLADRIVGTAWNDTEPMESQRDTIEALPVLAEEMPSREALLASTPDFVYTTYDGTFADEGGVGTRPALASAGIATYQSLNYCGDGATSLEVVYDDIRTLGRIFDVQDRAEAVISSIADEVDAAAARTEGQERRPRVFLFDTSGDPDGPPWTAACCGTANEAIDLAGGENIFADLEGTYFNFAQVSWEEVAARDPEVIVIALFAGDDAEEKKDVFRANPGLAGVTAVREDRFIIVPYSEIIPGIRAGSFVSLMAEGMFPK